MPIAALALGCAYLGLVFGVRALVLWRRTGDPGWAGRQGRPAAERAADVLFAGGWLFVGLGPALALAGGTPEIGALERRAVTASGIGLVVVAGAGAVWAQETMGPAWRTGVDAGRDAALVTGGPFALARHPVYTTMVAAAAGVALTSATAVAVAGAVVVLAALEVQARVVEEPALLARHGAAYRAYAERVGRFVPGIGRLR